MRDGDLVSTCPMCKRKGVHLTKHHLTPVQKGGKGKGNAWICAACHSAIHGYFSNRELVKMGPDVDVLMADAEFQEAIGFIQKQPPDKWIRFKRKDPH